MVGRTFRGLAVIGNGEIDLRQARFIDGETTIHATAIIGNITVVVPEDAGVRGACPSVPGSLIFAVVR
jgi:predicted membrane protein